MHDCRAVEVYIFHNVGPESAAFWNGLELCLVPIPAGSHALFSVGHDSLRAGPASPGSGQSWGLWTAVPVSTLY